MLGGGHALLDEVEDEAGGDEGHGKDDTDRHHGIHRGGQPEETTREKSDLPDQNLNSEWFLLSIRNDRMSVKCNLS